MIVKTSQRSGASWLAAHLTRTDSNESVRVVGGRGIVAQDVRSALRQFEAQWRLSGSRARDFLVHAALSPALPLSEAEWAEAWDLYEEQHGLSGQSYIQVEHAKPGDTGRPAHHHRVYLRIRPDGRAVHLGHSYRANEVVARLCELRFDHPVTKGAHHETVVSYLEKAGWAEEADRLRPLTKGPRPIASRSEAEAQQESRLGKSKAAIAEAVLAAWRSADGPRARRAALAEAGLALARGDRRDTVLVVSTTGEAWALHRLLSSKERGAWTAERIRRDLEGVIDDLPTLDGHRRGLQAEELPTADRKRRHRAQGHPDVIVTVVPPSAEMPIAPIPDNAMEAEDYWPDEPVLETLRPDPEPTICRLGAQAAIATAHEMTDFTGRTADGEVEPAVPRTMSASSIAEVPPRLNTDKAASLMPELADAPLGNAATPGNDVKPQLWTRRNAGAFNDHELKVASKGCSQRLSCGNTRQPNEKGEVRPRTDRRPAPGMAVMPSPDRPGTPLKRASVSSGRPSATNHEARGREDGAASIGASASVRKGRMAQSRPVWDAEIIAKAAQSILERDRDHPVLATSPVPAVPVASKDADQDFANRLRNYVDAVLEWWRSRQAKAASDLGDARRRLQDAWRSLVQVTQSLLKRREAPVRTRDVHRLVTIALARDHGEASEAHARWLKELSPTGVSSGPDPDRSQLTASRQNRGPILDNERQRVRGDE